MKNFPDSYYLTLLSHIFTKKEAAELVSDLRNFNRELYETKKDFAEKLSENLTEGQQEKILKLRDILNLEIEKPEVFNELVDGLDAYIDQIAEITVHTARGLPQKTIQKIGLWFENNLNRKVIIDSQVDQSLIGGAIIASQGKQFDNSVKSKLNKAFEQGFFKLTNLPYE